MQNTSDRIYIDKAGWNRIDEFVPFLTTVQEAVFNDRYIRFKYKKADGISERIAAALGLVSKGSIWYMVAAIGDEICSYRVSRMEEAEVLESHDFRPPQFDLAQFWNQSVASIPTQVPQYPVLLLCDSTVIPVLPRIGHWSRVQQIGGADGAGWCLVKMLFERDVDALKCVLENSPHMRVVEPVELKDRVISTLDSARQLYS